MNNPSKTFFLSSFPTIQTALTQYYKYHSIDKTLTILSIVQIIHNFQKLPKSLTKHSQFSKIFWYSLLKKQKHLSPLFNKILSFPKLIQLTYKLRSTSEKQITELISNYSNIINNSKYDIYTIITALSKSEHIKNENEFILLLEQSEKEKYEYDNNIKSLQQNTYHIYERKTNIVPWNLSPETISYKKEGKGYLKIYCYSSDEIEEVDHIDYIISSFFTVFQCIQKPTIADILHRCSFNVINSYNVLQSMAKDINTKKGEPMNPISISSDSNSSENDSNVSSSQEIKNEKEFEMEMRSNVQMKFLFTNADDYIIKHMKGSEIYNALVKFKGKELIEERKRYLNII
jgi:hypothetical protein